MSAEVEITARIVVPVTCERAWEVVTDWPGQSEWILATRSRGGHSRGAEVVARTGFGPIGFTDTMVITEWEPPRRCVMLHAGRVIQGAGIFELTPAGTACEFRWTEQLRLPLGAAGLLGWRVVRPLIQRGLDESLRRFARYVAPADTG